MQKNIYIDGESKLHVSNSYSILYVPEIQVRAYSETELRYNIGKYEQGLNLPYTSYQLQISDTPDIGSVLAESTITSAWTDPNEGKIGITINLWTSEIDAYLDNALQKQVYCVLWGIEGNKKKTVAKHKLILKNVAKLPQEQLPLDIYNAISAYSPARLSSTYDGPTIRAVAAGVGQDFTQEDILDGTLLSWGGTNIVWVNTLYNQGIGGSALNFYSGGHSYIANNGILELGPTGLPRMYRADAPNFNRYEIATGTGQNSDIDKLLNGSEWGYDPQDGECMLCGIVQNNVADDITILSCGRNHFDMQPNADGQFRSNYMRTNNPIFGSAGYDSTVRRYHIERVYKDGSNLVNFCYYNDQLVDNFLQSMPMTEEFNFYILLRRWSGYTDAIMYYRRWDGIETDIDEFRQVHVNYFGGW